MNPSKPHFLLYSESIRRQQQGRWRFVLQSLDGPEQLEAGDDEPHVNGERLELLAVVRGLEALPEPARVTLVTTSKYVNRGITRGLPEWRTNEWQWEHFGEMVPVKNCDLWQRVDRALVFHQVECRSWRFDAPHVAGWPTRAEAPQRCALQTPAGSRHGARRRPRRLRRFSLLCRRLVAQSQQHCRWSIGALGTNLLPPAWL